MRQGKILVALAALPMVFAGCDMLDIFRADSLEAPGIQLTGRVVFNGQPVPVRTPSNNEQLRVWHTSWEAGDSLRQPQAMNIHLAMDGSYSALVYPGTYDIQLVNDRGPWVNDTTRIPLDISGDMEIDIPVQPYYTIQEPSIVFTPPAAGDTTGGRITATFTVGQHVASPLVDVVGLYINTTTFVDRGRRHTGPRPSPLRNSHERTRAQVQTQLTNNQPISITLILPSDIRLTNSPELRTTLHARVGVKAVGVTELAYSEITPVSIAP